MKPRIRKVDGFWRCGTGILDECQGYTARDAWRIWCCVVGRKLDESK